MAEKEQLASWLKGGFKLPQKCVVTTYSPNNCVSSLRKTTYIILGLTSWNQASTESNARASLTHPGETFMDEAAASLKVSRSRPSLTECRVVVALLVA